MERCYGMSMDAFLEEGCSWFVRTAHIDHRRQLNLWDRICVRTRVAEIARREVKVAFEILVVGAEKVSASGHFDYILVDCDSGKARTIPDHVKEHSSLFTRHQILSLQMPWHIPCRGWRVGSLCAYRVPTC